MHTSRKRHKSQAILLILLALLPVIVVGGTTYLVDPLQIYRKQKWVEPLFWHEQRSQNAGKIRSYLAQDGYDSIILGNSVADNFRPSKVAEVLGWKKTMKLTIDGGTASEQAFTLKQALCSSNIRHVLWCIRPNNLLGNDAVQWHPRREMPFNLYSESIFDDATYLFSLDSFVFSKKLISGKSQWEHDLNRLNYWQSVEHIENQIKYNDPNNLTKLNQKRFIEACRLSFDENDAYPSADHNLIQIIQEHPEIEFLIVFAPQARHNIAINNTKNLKRYLGVQRHIISETKHFPNVKIFAFDNEDRIVNNIANYRDPIHYHSGINEYMLKIMARGENRLTLENVDIYIAEVMRKLCRFEVYSNFEDMIPLAFKEENEALSQILPSQSVTPFGDNLANAKKMQ